MKKSKFVALIVVPVLMLICGVTLTACGKSKKHTHDWGAWVTVLAPTCITEGTQTRVCKDNAAHTESRNADAKGHDWGTWGVTLASTCTTEGVETKICRTNSAHTETRNTEALEHDYLWGETLLAPTCTVQGTQKGTCQNNNTHITTRPIDALGHDYTWVTTTTPTATIDGAEAGTCKRNSAHTKTRIAYATGTAGLTFTLINNGTEYGVSRGTASISSTVFIPTYHYNAVADEYKLVTAFNNYAFSNLTSLPSIVIPASINRLGDWAFQTCTNLIVYYGGANSAAWDQISQGGWNPLPTAFRYYYSATNVSGGTHWRWVSGVPTIWP